MAARTMNDSVLLIQPPTVQGNRGRFARGNSLPPLGILSIGTSLQNRGCRVRVIDFLVEDITRDEFVGVLLEDKPILVGLGVYAETFRHAREISRITRQVLPDCLVVFGGAFSSFVYEEVLDDGNVDCVVRFEGERTIEELYDRVASGQSHPAAGVAGTAYRVNGDVRAEPPRAPVRDLDALPIPNRDLVKMDRYALPYSIMTSRGCPARCTYCGAGAFWTGVRFRSVDALIGEILYLDDRYGMADSGFNIADDTFNVRPGRVLEFCAALENCGRLFQWACEARVDAAGQDLFDAMYRSGCRRVLFGVESGVQSILDSVRKGITLEQIENAVAQAAKAGLFIIVSFMLGHPQDTVETMRRTIAFIESLQRRHPVYGKASVNTPFPGTYQYEHAGELGLRIHSDNWDDFTQSRPIVSTNHFTLEDLRRAYTEARMGGIAMANAELLKATYHGCI